MHVETTNHFSQFYYEVPKNAKFQFYIIYPALQSMSKGCYHCADSQPMFQLAQGVLMQNSLQLALSSLCRASP